MAGAVIVRECATCAALPRLDEGGELPPGERSYRPPQPRPVVHGRGPKTWRCATHRRADVLAQRQRASDQRSRKRSGLDEEIRQAVLAHQGGTCPCGRGPGKRLNLTAEHDHELAKQHEHAEDVACPECLVGFVCHSCNRHIIGFLTNNHGRANVAAVLHALADFLDDPPAQRVRRGLQARAELARRQTAPRELSAEFAADLGRALDERP